MVAVRNSAGTDVVTFKYDAFGKCTVSGDTVLAQWCRIRYRGYYFDAETGLYLVQTRYYNPDWCRWISPDSVSYLDSESPHGLNLYLYCGNDPINYVDPSGHSWESFWESVNNWFNATFGAYISTTEKQRHDGIDLYFAGIEHGIAITHTQEYAVKPIMFFVHYETKFWKFWEWEVGVSFNVNGHSIQSTMGLEHMGLAYSNDSFSVHLNVGAFETGIEIMVPSGNNVANYCKFAISPIMLGLAFVLVSSGAYEYVYAVA